MNATVSIADQINCEFPFEINKFPLSGPDGMRTDHYGLFRSDNSKCVGNTCKKGYVPHNNDDLIALAEAGMEGFDGATLKCKWYGDSHKIIIEPTKEYRRTVFGTQDAIFPRGIISAGYDGSAFVGTLGLYRDVCSNLHVLRSNGRVVSMRIRHTSGLRDKIDELVVLFRELMNEWNGVVDNAIHMNSVEIDIATFMSRLFPRPAINEGLKERNYLTKIQTIITRVANERRIFGRFNTDLSKATAWELYNGVQGYVQHDSRRHGRPDFLDRAFAAMDAPLVQKAYDTALALAS